MPLMAMLRTRAVASAAIRAAIPATLLYSARSWEELIYRDELATIANDATTRIAYTLTRSRPLGWTGLSRRIDSAMLADLAPSPTLHPHIYVCGPTGLVESAAQLLVDIGHDPLRIKTERFGPTGS